MKVGRTLSLAASAALVAGLGIAAAPTASAAGLSSDCATIATRNGSFTGNPPSFYTLGNAFATGETITATIHAVGSNGGQVDLESPTGTSQTSGNVGAFDLVLTYTLTGTASARLHNQFTSTSGSFAFTCTGASTPAATASGKPIPDWIQAYGRGGPDEVCRAGYNPPWAGGPGADVVRYTPSWERWMNNNTGGWVCTRTIPSLG